MLTDGAGGLALVMAGSGTLVLTGQNTFTKGTIASSSVVSVSIGGKLSGSGSVSAINGAGTVAPGGAQILTGTQVDPSAGMSFDFSFAQTGVPNYANASASGNDVLHLTNSTPFTFALTSANTVTLDFTGDSLQLGQIYYGGFFTTAGVPSSTFSNANFVYTGTFGPIVQYEGMVPVSGANFATGTASGEVMEFEVVAIPEPSSIGMALAGLGFLAVGATLSAAGLSLGTASFAESFPANSYRRLA
jgi:fibronectin-binding autotransporter adhesin